MFKEFLSLATELVKELSESINNGEIGLKETEEKVLEFINRLGGFIVESVVQQATEPTLENRIIVEDTVARYDKERNLSFISRFGNKIQRKRRCYKMAEGGGIAPLDEKLGIESCFGFSPLMTYLLSSFGGSGAFASEAKKLERVIGFSISSTAMQSNTEKTGDRIPEDPFEAIDEKEEGNPCDKMVVEIDGTMSPQISEIPGITGRESLKNPTEYKECNVVVIEKYDQGKLERRYYGALYGQRKLFDDYVRKTGLRMGQLAAKEVVFIADGAHTNWEIQKNNFPEATTILDFYHASEHLNEYCDLITDKTKSKDTYKTWRSMLREGDCLQVIEEMRERMALTTDTGKAWSQINYFQNNKDRMSYDEYEKKGYPLGSGLVEGSCKNIVNRRFKGSGMRWKKKNNECVLRVRLAFLNDTLHHYFKTSPGKIRYYQKSQAGVAA